MSYMRRLLAVALKSVAEASQIVTDVAKEAADVAQDISKTGTKKKEPAA